MAENQDEENLNKPEDPNSEGIILPGESVSINPNQESENMEVHHHSSHSHGKKNWKTYGWEFLMLFLAVFCGFLAEYLLEHVIEHQREKQYIESLVEDLKTDQEVISNHISTVRRSELMMDSLIRIVNNPSEIGSKTGDLYYLARLAPRLSPLSANNRTFEQLKNSGNFRLIRNLKTSNMIMAYYEKFPLIRMLETLNEEEFAEYKKIASKIFSPSVFLQMEGKNDEIKRGTDNPPLRTTDNELLQEFSVFAVYMHGTKKGIIGSVETLNTSGAELLKYLKEEYHLED